MKLNTEKIKTGLWGAVIGAIVVMIIGFGWGGWVLGSTSERRAGAMAVDAVVDRLVPICVAQFNQDQEKDERFKELQAKSSWDRDKYVREQGWATMPFEKEPDNRVAEKCLEQILQNGG